MVFERIQNLLVSEFKKNIDKVTLESRLQEDLDIDSLDSLELITAIEDEFEISIPDDDEIDIKTVGELVKFVEEKLK